ncbi:hypothetical protein V496_06660, partial [Pseudogymnoascus sp. VKM F-4515 (FW-2607)]
ASLRTEPTRHLSTTKNSGGMNPMSAVNPGGSGSSSSPRDEFIAGVEGGGEDDGGHDVVGAEERCDEGSDERVPGLFGEGGGGGERSGSVGEVVDGVREGVEVEAGYAEGGEGGWDGVLGMCGVRGNGVVEDDFLAKEGGVDVEPRKCLDEVIVYRLQLLINQELVSSLLLPHLFPSNLTEQLEAIIEMGIRRLKPLTQQLNAYKQHTRNQRHSHRIPVPTLKMDPQARNSLIILHQRNPFISPHPLRRTRHLARRLPQVHGAKGDKRVQHRRVARAGLEDERRPEVGVEDAGELARGAVGKVLECALLILGYCAAQGGEGAGAGWGGGDAGSGGYGSGMVGVGGIGNAGDAAVGVAAAAPDSVAVAGAAGGDAAATYGLGFIAFDAPEPGGWLEARSPRG